MKQVQNYFEYTLKFTHSKMEHQLLALLAVV